MDRGNQYRAHPPYLLADFHMLPDRQIMDGRKEWNPPPVDPFPSPQNVPTSAKS